MAFVFNIQNGEHYYTYPSEYNGEIELYKTPLFATRNAVFEIMRAIHNHQGYDISLTPKLIEAETVWDYKIKSPVMKEILYIKESEKNLAPKPKFPDDFPESQYVTEYEISVGDLYTLRTTDGILHYLADALTIYKKHEWINKNANKFKKIIKNKEEKLLEIGKSVQESQR